MLGPSAMTFQAPSRLCDAVVEYLGRAIAEGRLEAGARLVESEVCAELRVSRTPVREAIRVLAAEGLVTILPRRGARVADLTPKIVRDVFAVRMAIEGLCARLAAEHTTPAGLSQLKRLNDSMRRAVEQADGQLFFSLNEQFHSQIAAQTDNEYLMSLQQTAATRTFRPLFLNLSNLAHYARSVDDHDAVLDALTRGDRASADRVMQQHILEAQEEALRLIQIFADSRVPSSNTGEASA